MSCITINERSTPVWRAQILDENGHPISASSFSAITLDLYEKSSGEAINSREDQDVLDANNVSIGSNLTVSGATQASPVVITTSAAHGLKDGDKVYITGISGMTELNGRTYEIAVKTTTTFQLVGENGTTHTAYSSGGTIYTGLITWELQAADTAITGDNVPTGGTEEHIALFQFTWGSSRKHTHEFRFRVKNLNLVP